MSFVRGDYSYVKNTWYNCKTDGNFFYFLKFFSIIIMTIITSILMRLEFRLLASHRTLDRPCSEWFSNLDIGLRTLRPRPDGGSNRIKCKNEVTKNEEN